MSKCLGDLIDGTKQCQWYYCCEIRFKGEKVKQFCDYQGKYLYQMHKDEYHDCAYYKSREGCNNIGCNSKTIKV